MVDYVREMTVKKSSKYGSMDWFSICSSCLQRVMCSFGEKKVTIFFFHIYSINQVLQRWRMNFITNLH